MRHSMMLTVMRTLCATIFVGILLLISPASILAEEPAEEKGRTIRLPAWTERIRLSGAVEGDYTWSKRSDMGDINSDSTSDFLISTVELGVGVDFTDWIMGDVLLKAEDLGTEDETDIFVDEAFLTLQSEDFPLYTVFGKRAQPFGVFENHLVNDPMAQDAYETVEVGLTVGVTGPMDLDVSATVYRGEELMAHLFESELFDSAAVARVAQPAGNDASSYILSAAVVPIPENLTVFSAFISETGTGSRNNTLSVGANIVFSGFRFDVEYMKAIDREIYGGFTEEFKEGVISATLAYEFVLRERKVIGGALFAEEKAHIVSEPLELAVRFEHFDDDGIAEASGTWSVENRYGLGARYSFYNDPESGLAAYVAFEYRHTEYRLHASQVGMMADDNDETVVRLGVAF